MPINNNIGNRIIFIFKSKFRVINLNKTPNIDEIPASDKIRYALHAILEDAFSNL